MIKEVENEELHLLTLPNDSLHVLKQIETLLIPLVAPTLSGLWPISILPEQTLDIWIQQKFAEPDGMILGTVVDFSNLDALPLNDKI